MLLKSLIIVLFLLLLVWIPFFLDKYSLLVAILLNISFIIAGIMGEKMANYVKKKKAHHNR